MKKTVVIGASAKTDRYSNRAVRMLHKYGHDVIALGFEHAIIENTIIETDWKVYENIDTALFLILEQKMQNWNSFVLIIIFNQ